MALFLALGLIAAAGFAKSRSASAADASAGPPAESGILGAMDETASLGGGPVISGAALPAVSRLSALASLEGALTPSFPQNSNRNSPNTDPAGYFMMPASGFNWGKLHNYNAVDIANGCGTPVWAAAPGRVISDANLGEGGADWNAGYGNFVLIEHPGGAKTRYAHLEDALVKPGETVRQGEVIGLMGRTGEATGCHLHFEIIGAPNPFAS